jgi:hypothetical protein
VQGPLIRARAPTPAATRAWCAVVDRYERPRRVDRRPLVAVLCFVALAWMRVRAARTCIA